MSGKPCSLVVIYKKERTDFFSLSPFHRHQVFNAEQSISEVFTAVGRTWFFSGALQLAQLMWW